GSYQNIFGIISPHAGFLYSGNTAAAAYNTIRDKEYKTVVIISPSHREYFPGISIFSGDAYKTPLGSVPVNKEMADKLTSDEEFIFKGLNGHRTEHALEVQIPFLQIVLKNFLIVPIVLGDQRREFVEGLANKLARVVDEETLIVASSDLSHFYSKVKAAKIDSKIEKHLLEFDYDGLQRDLELKNCEACGGGGIVSLMMTAEKLNKKNLRVLSRSDSGDITGDNSEVVGYLSAIIY
ncbi:MAG: AmmeMemoRadiSam system protein B, partial [Melioribacteraceae bacterium]